EGAAAALGVQRGAGGGIDARRQQRGGGVGAQRRRVEPASGAAPLRRVERGGKPRGRPPERERAEQRPVEAAYQVPDDLDRGVVGPVEVVKGEDRGLLRRQALEERADRVMGAVALGPEAR